ncbi:MAG: hypothetical protein WCS01_09010 [bacterium]
MTSGPGGTWRGWSGDAGDCRSAIRDGLDPGNRSGDYGFRLSRTLP